MNKIDYYEKLLTSNDWKLFRLEILLRDKFRCAECENLNLIIDNDIKFEELYLFYIPFEKENKPAFWTNKEERVTTDKNYLQFFLKDKFSLLDYAKLKYLKRNAFVAYNQTIDGNTYHFGIASLPNEFEFKNGKGIPTEELIENIDDIEWHYSYGLNVHHPYYQDKLFPWEYPTEDLITICSKCHETLHQNETVPYYDKDGHLKGNLTSCKRCCGTGWFPQYKHVEAGICFECRGARYEEFQ